MVNKTKTIPLLPLRGILVFPYMIIHLDVGREKSISALEEAMVNDRLIMLAAQKDAQNDAPTPEEIFDVVTDELKKEHKVQVVGFGTFEVSMRAEREGRNPQTVETMKIAACKAPKFKAGKALKDAINE